MGMPIVGIKYFAQTVKRGFTCNDQSIRLPFHHSTIKTHINLAISYTVPITIILFHRIYKYVTKNVNTYSKKILARQIWMEIKFFIIGVLITQVISGAVKHISGRLRPNFIQVCNPTPSLTLEICGTYMNTKYITEYECMGDPITFPDYEERERYIAETKLSFVSGHTSLSTYAMTYTIIYIQSRIGKPNAIKIQTTIIQTILLVYAIGCGISRITDNKHHVSDVVAGALLGFVIACAIIISTKNNTKKWTERVQINGVNMHREEEARV